MEEIQCTFSFQDSLPIVHALPVAGKDAVQKLYDIASVKAFATLNAQPEFAAWWVAQAYSTSIPSFVINAPKLSYDPARWGCRWH